MKKKTFTAEERKAWAKKQKEETAKKLEEFTEMLKDADKIAAFYRTIFTVPDTVPMKSWTITNQFMVISRGGVDARGCKQWGQEGRRVKKGETALRIFIPCTYKKEVETTDEKGNVTTEEETRVSFKLAPVFDVHQTEGPELEYMAEVKKYDPSRLPLIDVANAMGIPVEYTVGNGSAYGAFYFKGKIELYTSSQQTFFHELAHAVDHRLHKEEMTSDRDLAEVVADYTGCFLSDLYGEKADLRKTRDYIERFSGKEGFLQGISKAMERVKNIILFIEEFNQTGQLAM